MSQPPVSHRRNRDAAGHVERVGADLPIDQELLDAVERGKNLQLAALRVDPHGLHERLVARRRSSCPRRGKSNERGAVASKQADGQCPVVNGQPLIKGQKIIASKRNDQRAKEMTVCVIARQGQVENIDDGVGGPFGLARSSPRRTLPVYADDQDRLVERLQSDRIALLLTSRFLLRPNSSMEATEGKRRVVSARKSCSDFCRARIAHRRRRRTIAIISQRHLLADIQHFYRVFFSDPRQPVYSFR